MRIAVAGSTGTVGRHLVHSAQARGHDMVPLSRSDGVDLRAGDGLGAALDDVAAVVDVTNAGTTDEAPATEFFTTVAGNVQRSGSSAGVGHIVTLSIVGIDRRRSVHTVGGRLTVTTETHCSKPAKSSGFVV